jgi:hypothetical protein
MYDTCLVPASAFPFHAQDDDWLISLARHDTTNEQCSTWLGATEPHVVRLDFAGVGFGDEKSDACGVSRGWCAFVSRGNGYGYGYMFSFEGW